MEIKDQICSVCGIVTNPVIKIDGKLFCDTHALKELED